jgi:hypothetical protein
MDEEEQQNELEKRENLRELIDNADEDTHIIRELTDKEPLDSVDVDELDDDEVENPDL